MNLDLRKGEIVYHTSDPDDEDGTYASTTVWRAYKNRPGWDRRDLMQDLVEQIKAVACLSVARIATVINFRTKYLTPNKTIKI